MIRTGLLQVANEESLGPWCNSKLLFFNVSLQLTFGLTNTDFLPRMFIQVTTQLVGLIFGHHFFMVSIKENKDADFYL